MSTPSEPPYRISPTVQGFLVEDEQERSVLECGDRQSAEQYVALLNEAYRRGYKAGFRAARRS